MTVSKAKSFIFVDTNSPTRKTKFFLVGSIIASFSLGGAFFIALYIEYLHNPAFHLFVQSKGIFL